MVSSEEEEIVVFRNCRLLRSHAIVKEDLWVRKGKIIDPGDELTKHSYMARAFTNPRLTFVPGTDRVKGRHKFEPYS